MREFKPVDIDIHDVIGTLDTVLSEFLLLAKDPNLNVVHAHTLEHHAEDLIGVGTKVLEVLGKVPVPVPDKPVKCQVICCYVDQPQNHIQCQLLDGHSGLHIARSGLSWGPSDISWEIRRDAMLQWSKGVE